MNTLGFDIGSNSVGSAWVDLATGKIETGISIFPAGVDETDEKRGEPKNAKRRMARRARITLARRSTRKRLLKLALINARLLPNDQHELNTLLETTDPWELRHRGLDSELSAFEFGRVLLHLSQRRGATGILVDMEDDEEASTEENDGKVKKAIGKTRNEMKRLNCATFGSFMHLLRCQRRTPITSTDRRPLHSRPGPREWRSKIRNADGEFEFHAERALIFGEFSELWEKQKSFGGATSTLLTDELRILLDNPAGDTTWSRKGFLFGQRRQTWDLGTLGRCILEPTERCVPHADMHASRFLVVETINAIKIIEGHKEPRFLTVEEREKIKAFLSGPLGTQSKGKHKGRPKRSVTVTDLRELMGWSKASPYHFNIENDEDRVINTDWFSREIIHGAVTPEIWQTLSSTVQEGINKALLKYNPEQENDHEKLKSNLLKWTGLSDTHVILIVEAWKSRPKPENKRLAMGRRAVRNLLTLMDRAEPWPDGRQPGQFRWFTQIEARRHIAENRDFLNVTTGKPLDEHAKQRYATGAKGATAKDRQYMKKHVLMKNGKPIFGPDGTPLAEPPPAPMISNPVTRKAIHEVRRHLIEYMIRFERKPDRIFIELAREARMGAKDADALLSKNRLRNRIRNDIIEAYELTACSATQQRAAIDRIVLCVQQDKRCALCGNTLVTTSITPRMAAVGQDCEVAHIIPRASGGHNGLSNLVLAHTKCNRDMGRRTPREFWDKELKGGFESGMRWIDGIYGKNERLSKNEAKGASGEALWKCYFSKRDDWLKIEQFGKTIADIQGMTSRQLAATQYATRQVMAYLSEALYDGKGLPERGGERRIFATDGIWTGRLRREWGLFFDPHGKKTKGLKLEEQQERKEKDRGDHRHHAIDAVTVALTSPGLQQAWEKRELQADREGVNTADGEAMNAYRHEHRLLPEGPYRDIESFRNAVESAVFGSQLKPKPVCHRPVKRKLIGALHEETLFGPVLDQDGRSSGHYTARKAIVDLKPSHLRLPRLETEKEALDRLAARRKRQIGVTDREARKWARCVVTAKGFKPALTDPSPEISGLVRDLGLRKQLRECIIQKAHGDPDDFSKSEIQRWVNAGHFAHISGIPIRSFVLLRTMTNPVIVHRKQYDPISGKRSIDSNPVSRRAYKGGNNHHVEIRVDEKNEWKGEIVTSFDVSQRKVEKLKAFRAASIPKPKQFRALSRKERAKYRPAIRDIEAKHPIVDRMDDPAKGGRFIMSLCEGETLRMRHKVTGIVDFFVVVKLVNKLDEQPSIFLVSHWDARPAELRMDIDGKQIVGSKRDSFSIKPSELKSLAPDGCEHAQKIWISPSGRIRVLQRD